MHETIPLWRYLVSGVGCWGLIGYFSVIVIPLNAFTKYRKICIFITGPITWIFVGILTLWRKFHPSSYYAYGKAEKYLL